MSQPILENPAPPVDTVRQRSAPEAFWRAFRKNKGAVAGAGAVLLFLAVALLAPVVAPTSPVAQDLGHALLPPSRVHLLGTDEFGRDVFARVVYGARTALWVGLAVVGLSGAVGSLVGLVAGYYGGALDNLLMRVVDVLLAFPFLLLALMVVAALGPGVTKAVVAVAVAYTPVYARLARSVALRVKELEFVAAARAMGARDGWILSRHLVPNLAATLLVQATLNIGTAIIDISGLSFLGLGAQPPAPDWGAMLADGQTYILQAPWLVLAPGLAILVVVLAFNLVGDGLRDALDPRLGRRG
jgi:peptide/nickel transport system permease protein